MTALRAGVGIVLPPLSWPESLLPTTDLGAAPSWQTVRFSQKVQLPEATSHKRAVPSSLAVTSFLESLLSATAVAMPAWPMNVRTCLPVLNSHNRTAPSQLPVTNHLLSLLRAIEMTISPTFRVDSCSCGFRSSSLPCSSGNLSFSCDMPVLTNWVKHAARAKHVNPAAKRYIITQAPFGDCGPRATKPPNDELTRRGGSVSCGSQ